jgi:hypothetical protein
MAPEPKSRSQTKTVSFENARALSPHWTRIFEFGQDGVPPILSIRSPTQKLHKAEEQERNSTATATETRLPFVPCSSPKRYQSDGPAPQSRAGEYFRLIEGQEEQREQRQWITRSAVEDGNSLSKPLN